MQLIYATGQPRQLRFAVVDRRQDVPAGATVLAICDGTRHVSQLEEHFFAAITDEEYYTYMELLREVVKREKTRLNERHQASAERRFANWLSGVLSGDTVPGSGS